MPTYRLHLHDGPTNPPIDEILEATDDQEARSLAEMRLLLSHAFTHVELWRDDQQLAALRRDSQR